MIAGFTVPPPRDWVPRRRMVSPNTTRTTVETLGGHERVIIASTAVPLICNVIRPRDPEFPAMRRRAAEGRPS